MRNNNKFLKLTKLLIAFSLFIYGCCSYSINKFQIEEINTSGSKFAAFQNMEEIAPLKKQWKEMYCFVKKGHIQKASAPYGNDYIISYQVYNLINENLLVLYEVPFMQHYENLIKVFGEPSNSYVSNDRIIIAYYPSIIGDSCETCTHNGFSFTFDAKSKKLVKE